MVLDAASSGEAQAAALEQLCRAYWQPLYAYVRRRGHKPEDAQDLTQAFFEHLLEKNFLANVTREGGRFRSFLLTVLNRFLANAHERGAAEAAPRAPQLAPIPTLCTTWKLSYLFGFK